MPGKLTTLIFAAPGPLRESLNNFLAALPQVKIVGNAQFLPEALEEISRCAPHLLILDTHHWNGAEIELLRQVKARWPRLYCLVLADRPDQVTAARAAGAEEALLWGFSTDTFLTVIQHIPLATQVENTHE
jgi:DNA-binding NarL/FixJ family response regulator